MFRVIEGGQGLSGKQELCDEPNRVLEEGRRRLRDAGVDRYEIRERVTGIPMPSALRNFKLQVEFAASALAQLSPLPPDYRQDGYWPCHIDRAALT